MHRYTQSLLWLVSLSIYSYPMTSIAKEQKNPKIGDVNKEVFPLEIPDNLNNIILQPLPSNTSMQDLTVDVTITGTKHFCSNYACFSPGAGAIKAKNLNIIGNFGPIIFRKNLALIYAGVLYSEKTCTIANNPKGVLFHGNHCLESTGVINANSLIIRDNGPVLFLNNSSASGQAKGGTLQNHGTDSRFYLSADYGDIIFNGNITNYEWRTRKNSILGKENLNLQVGARKGRKVAFFDPVEHEALSTEGVTFNPENFHLGTVLFSSKNIPLDTPQEAHFLSSFRNSAKLSHGALAIDDKARVGFFNFTQDPGTTLRLGNASVVQTNVSPDITTTTTGSTKPTVTPGTTTGCSLSINQLALNLPSLCQEDAQAPKIWIYPKVTTTKQGNTTTTTYTEDTNPNVTISGALTLLDSDNQDPYDSVDLSKDITGIPFLYLCDTTSKKIDIANLDIEAINKTTHYGYQGSWLYYWLETTTTTSDKSPYLANTSHRRLYADWSANGYKANPKYNTALVANALWQTFYSTMSAMRSSQPLKSASLDFEGQGLGIFTCQKSKGMQRGFHMKSAGYSLATAIERSHSLSFSFAQQACRIKEKVSHNKLSSKNYFGGMQMRLPWKEEGIITTTSLAYSYGDHKIKHLYEELKASEGSFHSHSLAAAFNCSLRNLSLSNRFTLFPFVEAVAFRATLSKFQETGDFIRKFFQRHALYNITLPLGVTMESRREGRLPRRWQAQLAYHPVVYRKQPEIHTILLSSKGTWSSSGTPISRSSIYASINNETQLASRVDLVMSYQGELSTSTFSNYLKVGSSITF
ncbi:polymorphic outer membrane protein middle domain-containing protein [Chlamydia vaughanii]|uniref:polymorphic outer membrane protein middle domain-containing protein n=1 Tax=Chlamydia vaughanii TaxID=3112552 RepID=UPI0032B21489